MIPPRLCVALALFTASLAQAAAPDAPLAAPVASHHSVALAGGRTIAYDAVFSELGLPANDGALAATISATAYVREDAAANATRPVVFLFNGGPGASSSPLHFGAVGPRRFVDDASGKSVPADNPASLIDVADLVFIDPAGTGFSQAFGDPASNPYWGIAGDAGGVAALVRDWLKTNHREGAPIFIVGESYGGFRAAQLVHEIADLPVAGVVLVSPLLDLTASDDSVGNDLPFVLNLPSMAVAAWTHGCTDKAANGKTAAQVYETARRYALGDYAAALMQGARLPPAQRQRASVRLHQLIGLPADAIAQADLRVDSETFLNTLLADRQLRIGRLDSRLTGSTRPAPAGVPSNDPGLPHGGNSPRIEAYLHDELHVPLARPYLALNFGVNGKWNWQPASDGGPVAYINPTHYLGDAMRKNPALRVLATGGYYDMAVPLLGTDYALAHAGLPMDRVTLLAYANAHSPYDTDADRQRFSDALRAFVLGVPATH
jgi:carboxypeptidase C (cathepsin A)